METIQQRTDEWHELRKGKFTASEIYKLMGIKALGETGKGYAFDKAVEQVYGETEESFISFDMQRGIELEPLAFAKFQELKDAEFLNVETCGFFGNEIYGASPDGLVGSDAILEIKCPKPSTFFKIVANNEIKDQYLYQMQLQMMVTGRNKAYFFNYCIIEGVEYWHEIEVLKDDVICDKIKERINEANELKKEYINQLNNNKQWN